MNQLPDTSGRGAIVYLVALFLAYGGFNFISGLIKDHGARKDAAPREVDANILTVTRAKEGVERDLAVERVENGRLRQALADEEDRAARREAALRAEIEHLETRLHDILDELTALKSRHGITTRGAQDIT